MTYILNQAKTMRNLQKNQSLGNYYAYFTAGLRLLEFFAASNDRTTPAPIDIKPGATFYQDGYKALVTVQGGAGNTYLCDPGVLVYVARDRHLVDVTQGFR